MHGNGAGKSRKVEALDVHRPTMNGADPWQRITNADYERHMGHPSVGQLSVLSRKAQDQLALVHAMLLPKVVILGVANGNGLEHVDPVRYRSVVGIDINAPFLAAGAIVILSSLLLVRARDPVRGRRSDGAQNLAGPPSQ